MRRKMSKEEVAKQEAIDFNIFSREVLARQPEYTVTATEYGMPYDCVIDTPDLSNILVEIKQRNDTADGDFDYYLIRKSKVDNLRQICEAEKKDGYVAYLLQDCWYLFPVNTDYTSEVKFVSNELYGDREEESYQLHPEQGIRLTYINNATTTMTDGTETDRQ